MKSFIVGLVFGGFNLWLLERIVAGMLRGREIPAWKTGAFFLGKMTLLFVTIGLLLWRGHVTPLAFLGGFTVSLVAGLGWRALSSR